MTQLLGDNVIFCKKCGKQNKENNFKCVNCGFVLHEPVRQQYVITDDNALGGLIPYKNPKALWAYYLGIFSLVPIFGFFLSIPAIILGVLGLKCAKISPQVKGKVHAWVGIILGSACAALYVFIFVLPIIAAFKRH